MEWYKTLGSIKQLKIDNCDIEITCEDCGNIFEIENVTFEIAGINYKN